MRALLLKKGDNNSKSFHLMANAHQKENFISRLKINGDWIAEGIELKAGISCNCKSMFENCQFRRSDVA